MRKIFTRPYIYIPLFFRSLPLIVLLGMMGAMGYGQLVPNTYTPITSANALAPTPSADDQNCGGVIPDGCVTNLANVIGNLEDAATITSLVGATHWIDLQFNETAPAGSYAGFVIAESGLLANIEVSVSNDNDTETVTASSLLSLGIGGNTKVGFYPSIAFDRIRISYTAPVAGSLNVFYAEVMVFEAADPLTCNVPTVMNRPDFPLTVRTDGGALGNVANPENAIDADPNNYATMSALVAGAASLSVKDEVSSYPANTYVGFDIDHTTILSLELLNSITINTYLDGDLVESHTGAGQLAAVGLLSSSASRVGFLTTEEFDEVEISITSLGLNLGSTLVYNAVIQCFTAGPGLTDCNEPNVLTAPEFPLYISERTGISGVLDANSEIIDAGNVIDVNTSNFAQLNFLAAVGSEISLGVRDAVSTYPAGTYVGFDIEKSASLLNLNLLNSLTITSYLDGVQQQSIDRKSVV